MQIPQNIIMTVEALLKPYGISVDVLRDNHDNRDTRKRRLTIEDAEKYSSLSRWALLDAARKGYFRQSKLGKAKRTSREVGKSELGRA